MNSKTRISPRACSEYKGQEATIIQREIRRLAPYTKVDRYDYLLRCQDGREMWFADNEIVLQEDDANV